MIKKAIALLIIVFGVYVSFSSLMPSEISTIDAPDNEFSTQRALVHLKKITKAPHYLGSEAHAEVGSYILKELKNLGLETQIQEGYAIGEWGNLSKPRNIIGRLKGSESGKALLLLTHYDSHPHSSFGASDAGSGVVTILEGLRAFLNTNKQFKNDVIVLFTDGEELGLNGADIFVNKHPWAKEVGLALNFEARGSGGPSIMLVETNQGNANLIQAFVEANPEYPLGNSLFYSIYKMLPNDTDLTRFRKDADINGFNFAFVDDHFDYHTALDTYDRLDRTTLEHQGAYLMPLLYYFSNADLSKLKSIDDVVYFNMPFFKMVTYPYSWVFPMYILGVLLFIIMVFYGIKKRSIEINSMVKGVVAFFSATVVCGLVGYFGWQFINVIYPHYSEMLHGFTYNGHTYIVAFVALAIAICLLVYHKVYKPENAISLFVAPLFFWLLISGFISFKLQGASFFIIPVYFGLIGFFLLLRQKKPNLSLLALLGLPAIFVFVPMMQMFPVGLGLKMLVASTVLVALVFGLLIPVFSFFRHKKRWGYLFLIFALYSLGSAHLNSDFNWERPKPNSLLYIFDADDNTAKWATYDESLDQWTSAFFEEEPSKVSNMALFNSKYDTQITQTKKANIVPLKQPLVEVSIDTIIGETKFVEFCISPQRDVQRIEIFTDTTNVFNSFRINKLNLKQDEEGFVFSGRKTNRLFTYFVSKNEPLEMLFSVPKSQQTVFHFYEASYDLLENDEFNVPKRYTNMIPKPFVLNDAVVVKKSISVPGQNN